MISSSPLKILLVEDNPGDVQLIREYLLDSGEPWAELQGVGTLAQALEALPRLKPDVVLLDLGLPDSAGLEGPRRILARSPLTPLVILTGLDDQELAGRAVAEGAQDFLVKSEVSGGGLRRVIRYAVERMGAWRALQESEAKYQDLYENAPEMLVSVDPESGTVLECNAALADATGWSKGELVGKPVLELYHPRSRERAREAFDGLNKSGRIMGEELEILTRAGEAIHVSLNVSAFRDEGGRILFSRSSLRDITVRKKVEEDLAASMRELQCLSLSLEERVRCRTLELDKANRELEAFAYSVSHDLRGPLRAIDGFSRILEEEYQDRLDGEGLRLLGVVRENTARMGQLIEDLLEFSRVGRKEMRSQPVDMGNLVEKVVRELEPGLWEGRGKMVVGPLPSAQGDPHLLRQVWVNLLSNAGKFSRDEEAPLVEVDGWEEGGELVYRVKDNGVGFNQDFAGKLFRVFERLHRQDEFEGTGVGLALVSRIMERHGGRIWGEGVVGQGATFWFTLPLIKGEEE